MSTTPLLGGADRRSTPTTLHTDPHVLTRAQIYSEFRFFHGLAGGKQHVDRLTRIYTFDPKDQTKAQAFLDCQARYSALEQEMTRRREAEALWKKYVHSNTHKDRLDQVAHMRTTSQREEG